jgi:hypothetical protein
MERTLKEDFYRVLGKLFFAIASIDGGIRPAERKSLHRIILNTWDPIESAVDDYGTDLAEEIEFSFDYEEEEGNTEEDYRDFENFYSRNKSVFGKGLKNNILKTATAIANAYRGENKREKEFLEKLRSLLRS